MAAHPPHDANAEPGVRHTGVGGGQLAVEMVPALAVHLGVMHAPLPGGAGGVAATLSQAWPAPHCVSCVHRTTSVAELTAPALMAVMMSEPRGRFAEGTQDHVPSGSTETVQMVMPLTETVTVCPGMPVPAIEWRSSSVFALPPEGGDVSATAGWTHRCPEVSYTWPAAHGPHNACVVSGLLHTGVDAAQSAIDPVPAFPRHEGVVQPPEVVSHACPDVHWGLPVQSRISVAVLVAPPLVAVTISVPTDRLKGGAQVHAPSRDTEVVQTDWPLTVSDTLCPGTPVPVIGATGSVVLAKPPAGGAVSTTSGETQPKVVVLNTWLVGHEPQDVPEVGESAHTGAARVQSAAEPAPLLPWQLEVRQVPLAVKHSWPAPHCPSSVHATTRTPLLATPPLVATMVLDPSGRSADAVQVHVPAPATVAEQMDAPLSVMVTV